MDCVLLYRKNDEKYKKKKKSVKNKVAEPFKVVEVDIIYGKGISHEGELLDIAVEKEVP